MVKGTVLSEVIWQTNSGNCKICYTSFEKSNENKPEFETAAIPDDFMNIVKDCVKTNQQLVINLHGKEISISVPLLILRKLLEN